jgi:hypothetical protein
MEYISTFERPSPLLARFSFMVSSCAFSFAQYARAPRCLLKVVQCEARASDLRDIGDRHEVPVLADVAAIFVVGILAAP